MGEEASLFPKKESGHGAGTAADFLCTPQSLLEAEVVMPRLKQILCGGKKHQRRSMLILEPRSCNIKLRTIIVFLTTSAFVPHHESLV